MSQQSTSHLQRSANAHDDFLTRFWKNLYSELALVLQNIGLLLRMLLVFIFGVFFFLRDFSLLKEVLSMILPPAVVFLVGAYLTLLPIPIVIILAAASIVVPIKFIAPIMGICALFGLFIVFLT